MEWFIKFIEIFELALSFFDKTFNWFYLLVIVLGGKIITMDEIVNPLPFKWKAFLMRIGAAWRIGIFSCIAGIIIHFTEPEIGGKKLILTFLLANSLYALFFKWVLETFVEWIKRKLAAVFSKP